MMTNLEFLGIYPDAIDRAINRCEEVMTELGFTVDEIDDMNDYALQNLEEWGDFKEITNSIIAAYFDSARSSICERYPGIVIYTYVNCHDSHFDAKIPKPMVKEEIRKNWEAALGCMPTEKLSEAISEELTDEDLRELARLHRSNILRPNIEDLLCECGFNDELHSFMDFDYNILSCLSTGGTGKDGE